MQLRPWAIGLFLTLGFAIFTGILFLIGDRQKAFSNHVVLYTDFSDLGGLSNAAKVRVSGLDAGRIKKIEVPQSPSAKFRLELQIEEKVHGMIRKDSVVSIETEGLVGDKFVSIKKGTNQAGEATTGVTLPSKEPLDVAALMEKGSVLLNDVHGSVTDIRGRVDVALDSMTKTVSHADTLMTGVQPNINKIANDGREIAGHINALVTDLDAGKGPVGMLLRDEVTKQQLRATLSEMQQASGNVNQASERANETIADFQSRGLIPRAEVTLENMQAVSQQLNTTVKDVLAQDNMGEDGASNLRETLSNLNRSTTNLAEDTESLKHNFFFRGFFKKRGFYDLDQLTAAEYLEACERRKNTGTRKWLQASSLVVKRVFEKSGIAFGLSIEFPQTRNDAEPLLCNRPDQFSLGTHLASSSGSAARGSTAHNRCTCGIGCDLLSAANRMPVATSATGISGVGHRLPLLPKLEERGRVDVYSEGNL